MPPMSAAEQLDQTFICEVYVDKPAIYRMHLFGVVILPSLNTSSLRFNLVRLSGYRMVEEIP